MPKVKRILRSVRFKYSGAIKRITTWSNFFILIIFLFIAALVFSFSEHGPYEDIFAVKLDNFKAADYVKISYYTTTKSSSTSSVKKITKDNTATTKNAPVKSNTAKEQWMPNMPPKHLFPIIKIFYRDTSPLNRPKTTEIHSAPPKKLTYRDIFDAMAHPRVFVKTTEKFERSEDNHPKTGLNDWIQVSAPTDIKKLLAYSAYWDDRFEQTNIVRIMVVMPTKNPPTVYCRVQMEDGTFNDVPSSRKIMNEHWRLKYASYFISCDLSKKIPPPAKVFISTNRNFTVSAMLPVYRNKENKVSPRGDVAVCVKPLHYYYNRATWLLEFIELHRILGVEHFFFYNHSVGEDVDVLLRHYMKQNIVTVLPWNLPVRSQKEIRTEGIFSSLNDCVFRTMYLFHYVIMLDFDEYIIPREHDNYLDMLEKIEEDNKRIRGKPGSFVFRNVFFYLYWKNDTLAYSAEPETPPLYIPYLITQYKTRRLVSSMKTGSRSKYIVVPERVIEVGNHVVWRHTSGSRAIQVHETVALLHHYRICEFGGFSCLKKPSLIDRTANKFSSELLRRVFEQCQNIYPELEGKCPISPPLGSPW